MRILGTESLASAFGVADAFVGVAATNWKLSKKIVLDVLAVSVETGPAVDEDLMRYDEEAFGAIGI